MHDMQKPLPTPADLAQLAEHPLHTGKVPGSYPGVGISNCCGVGQSGSPPGS